MMKLKLLLLFLLFVGYGALVNAQKKPYNNLIITEARMDGDEQNYVELTNMGTETIDLAEFEFGAIGSYTKPWFWETARNIMLPQKLLAPGKSFVIATACDFEPRNWKKDPTKNRERVTKPEMYKLADVMYHMPEYKSNKSDSITPKWQSMESWGGTFCWYLKHIYTIDGVKDSMIIDQVGGIFTQADGTNEEKPTDVAGIRNATGTCVLIRKATVKSGITEFSSHDANDAAALSFFNNKRGLDYADSEWMPVPFLLANSWTEGFRAAFWTVGNNGDNILDANTLVPKTGSKMIVDFNAATIMVPWGIRNDDSIMYQFNRKPGLAWHYDYGPTTADSAYVSAHLGDKLTLYVCGNQIAIKTFSIIVTDPTPSANIVIPKNYYDYKRMRYDNAMAHPYCRVSEGVKGMDTIRFIGFATRVDSLFKYLEKAPKATWKVVFKDGIDKPDLKSGDKLSVTAENGTKKDYFLKLDKIVVSSDAYLSSITWPDMPVSFKGAIANLYGWKGDTIPGFSSKNYSYIVQIPLDYSGIPALAFHKSQVNSQIVVTRAKTLDGTAAQATATFKVMAENDTIINVYTVLFQKEKEMSNTQPYKAEPFISQIVEKERWYYPWVEIVNPGTEPLDLSQYMILYSYGNSPIDALKSWNNTYDFSGAYRKYVPGKKWQDEANWLVRPRILENDMSTNALVAPGDVFVMSAVSDSTHPYFKAMDFNFCKTPWKANYGSDDNIAIGIWHDKNFWFYKITNDSVLNGLKPATDLNDFKLIETFGNEIGKPWTVAGRDITGTSAFIRKPTIYKGNPIPAGSFGTNLDDSEWIVTKWGDNGWSDFMTGIGSHFMNAVTVYKSTVSSLVYKVSPGYSNKETIKGLITGTTVTEFYTNILKANALQTLKVKSFVNGNELAEANPIINGDTLIVLSADGVNTSKYILDVTKNGISSDALLTSTPYTISATGTAGTIAGFNQGTLLKDIVAGVIVPAGATLTMTDANDAYMTLTKLNYDTVYVNVIATDKINFEVIAENGTTRILYQLTPTTNPGDAYITSDLYSVDQLTSLINFIPAETTVASLMNNVYPAPGAAMAIFDKTGLVRETGTIYRDDKLVVTAADGKTTKAYYFSMLNVHVNKYLAYVISADYQIDQVKRTIVGPFSSTTLIQFYGKLEALFGATLSVLDKDGNVSSMAALRVGDQLLVTAADGLTTAVYGIIVDNTGIGTLTENIKMYPNPTTDKVIINGLSKGNRVQVLNAGGVMLRDVIVENSTDYVSLSSQPAGVYIIVISSGNQHINIQKIIKK